MLSYAFATREDWFGGNAKTKINPPPKKQKNLIYYKVSPYRSRYPIHLYNCGIKISWEEQLREKKVRKSPWEGRIRKTNTKAEETGLS